jgi:NTP pyrophosphatase (non-canonical NTP hydrolase)
MKPAIHTFKALHQACLIRWREWMGMDPSPVDLIFATNEMAGETGEACNVAKKIARTRRGVAGGVDIASGTEHLAEELADVVICAQNVALMAGIDLAPALVAKFNKTSDKNGLRTKFIVELDGVELIAGERLRQQTIEGWTPEHDDRHTTGDLAKAAAAYALTPDRRDTVVNRGAYDKDYRVFDHVWPWESEWWKPTPDDRVRELVKAGALIAAEIDRLQRLATKGGAS